MLPGKHEIISLMKANAKRRITDSPRADPSHDGHVRVWGIYCAHNKDVRFMVLMPSMSSDLLYHLSYDDPTAQAVIMSRRQKKKVKLDDEVSTPTSTSTAEQKEPADSQMVDTETSS